MKKAPIELKDQLSSLKLSKRLKELWVKQESFWWWTESISENGKITNSLCQNTGGKETIAFSKRVLKCEYSYYSAFTVAELGEMLPKTIDGDRVIIIQRTYDDQWTVDYRNKKASPCPIVEIDKNLANVCAKMLINLIEKGLVKL